MPEIDNGVNMLNLYRTKDLSYAVFIHVFRPNDIFSTDKLLLLLKKHARRVLLYKVGMFMAVALEDSITFKSYI